MPLDVTPYLVTFGALCVCAGLVVIRLVRTALQPASSSSSSALADLDMSPGKLQEFHAFQRQYLIVFLLCAFSDWLKGPYVYALYEEYGFTPHQISVLFVGGFFSSLVFGTVVGSWSDRMGRKFMCIVFCGVYALSALTKPINSFALLLFGRILSGVATSLLFTAFESWMVAEHHARGFPEALLTGTFSRATLGNGVVAVLAGIVAQFAASNFGYAAPFLVAVPCLSVAALLMTPWRENYGDQSSGRVWQSLVDGFEAVRSDRGLLALGACEAVFEACIYIWVFYWTPAVADDETKREVPYGLLFASYMAAFMVGGAVPDMWHRLSAVAAAVHTVAGCALLIGVVFFEHKILVFLTFVAFEFSVGMYFPTHGTLRSRYVPEATRASVMNLFRLPMNVLVVGVLQLQWAPRSVMMLLVAAQIVALGVLRVFQTRRIATSVG